MWVGPCSIVTLESLLAPKASKASMGASYFRQRAIGDCNYGVCGDCNAINLVTVGLVCVVIVMPLIWLR